MAPLPPREVGKVSLVANVTSSGAIGTASVDTDVRAIEIAQTTAGLTLTLPSPGDTSVIAGLDVINTGSASFTMYGVVVAPSTMLRCAWTGSAWVADTGVGSSSLNATSASMGLPAGGIIKAGQVTASSGTATFTFPVAFPTACVSLTANAYVTTATTAYLYSVVVKSYNATGATLIVSDISGVTIAAASVTVLWQAIGY